ncbi:MAG TPA: glucose-6-phosphate isomerase, partial [Lachnospiraceae bacterium]|nr:glucose-6-phosphate isomerase [Lachnospiraceae bacterium]
MVSWNNMDSLKSFDELKKTTPVDLAKVMTGENGAERVKKYSVPMAEGMAYNYGAKAVDDTILDKLAAFADEAQLVDKFEELYNGEVINTGEKRLVLHQLCRGQLGNDVVADGVNKRAFYTEQQAKIADFVKKVHAGEIVNEKGEKFTTAVQIGIGGSDLGPRAIYIALENWAKKTGNFKMEAKFISNVDPDDAAAVLNSVDVAHSIFVLVSKSGTTLETLTNESFVKDALKKAGLDASKHMIAVTSETSPLAKSSDYLAAFFMDDYIGGRFSSSSAVGGAILSLAFGPD